MSKTNSSTLKALDVLEMLAEEENGLRLTDVADGAGYPRSTARRLLVSLIEAGYVEQNPETSRYYLGVKILTLQSQGLRHRHVLRRAYPYLARLQRQLDETVNLGVLSDKSVVYVETLAPETAMTFYAPPGTRMPLHCTAMGKMFLAHLTLDARETILNGLELKQFTPHTLTSLDDLRSELSAISVSHFASDREEFALGVRCVAGPIYAHDGKVVAGVSMTALSTRCTEARLAEMRAALETTCRDISQTLGGGWPASK